MKFALALFLISLCLTACSRRVERSSASNIVAPSDAVNVNTATVDELEKLPHIGRKTAEAIVEFRTQNGPFDRVEQIMLIRGISENRFNDIRPRIRVE